MAGKEKKIYFHLGLERTATTFLQKKVFPAFEHIQYIPKKQFREKEAIIENSTANRILVTHEFDEEWFFEINAFHKKYPNATPIIALRKHSDWLLSQFKRAIKNGEGMDFETFVKIKKYNGKGASGSLNFYDKLLYLEKLFGKKPILFFYQDFVKEPIALIRQLAECMGASINEQQLTLKPIHTSYNEKQNLLLQKMLHKFNNHSFLQTKAIRYSLLTIAKVMPSFLFAEELVSEKKLKQIDKEYAEDWQKCLAYPAISV